MASDVETYIAHVERVVGKPASGFFPVGKGRPGLPPVTAVLFEASPYRDCLTAVTYGLSLVARPEWKLGRPELMISVQSTDKLWAMAIADVAQKGRDDKSFTYGTCIDFQIPVSEESPMSAFLVFAPTLVNRSLNREESSVRLSSYTIHLAGMYPLHAAEMALYREIGLERFWHLPDFDPWNVQRPDLSLGHGADA